MHLKYNSLMKESQRSSRVDLGSTVIVIVINDSNDWVADKVLKFADDTKIVSKYLL